MPTNTVGDRTQLAGLALQRQHKLTWLNATVPIGTAGQFSEINLAGSGFTTTFLGKRLTITFAAAQAGVLWQDEGVALGTSGTVDTVNFVGTPVVATRVGNTVTVTVSSSASTGANPSALVGLAAVNGVAVTFMRSDAAPPLDQSIVPTWTGAHIHNGALTIGADTYFNGVISPSALSLGNNNDYNPASLATANILRLTPNAGGSTITGITAPATASKVMYLINALGLSTITLSQADTNSAAANRFSIGSSITLSTGQGVGVWYDGTSARWRLLDAVSSASFAPTSASYLTLANDATLTAERVLTAGSGISFVDTGANGTLTINAAVTPDVLAAMAQGTGEDGNCDLDGTNTFTFMSKSGNNYTLLRNVAIDRLRITTGCTLDPSAFHSYYKSWDVTTGFNGKITVAGANAIGQNGGASPTITGTYFGSVGSVSSSGSLGSSTNSAASSTSSSAANAWGGSGGKGGKGGNSGANTAGAVGAAGTATGYAPISNPFFLLYQNSNTAVWTGGIGGTGGTGGAGDGTNAGGTGGGGGGSAAAVDLFIGNIITDGTTLVGSVSAAGGAGAAGTAATLGNAAGAGGGGGGAGGAIRCTYGKHTGAAVAGFFDASGGAGGNGGAGHGTGGNGTGGDGAQSGRVFTFCLATGTWTIGTLVSANLASGLTGGAAATNQVTLP